MLGYLVDGSPTMIIVRENSEVGIKFTQIFLSETRHVWKIEFQGSSIGKTSIGL
jgi:hypothetical protein